MFTTSVSEPEQISRVQPLLTSVPTIEDWNFDLEDCDRILRVEGDGFSVDLIILFLQNKGHHCEILSW